jgi:hypothetical protein
VGHVPRRPRFAAQGGEKGTNLAQTIECSEFPSHFVL